MGTVKTLIGTWHEKEAREFSENHTYYAADWRKIRVEPGDYPAYLTWDMTGYLKPLPKMLWVEVKAQILGGQLFNGFGGVNYSSEAVQPRDHTHLIYTYDYLIKGHVEKGDLTLNEGWEWLTLDMREMLDHARENYPKDRIMSLVDS